MSSNRKVINGREYLLLPVEVLGTVGEAIREAFYLTKRHIDYVKITEFVPLWIQRGVHWIPNKEGKQVACYAVSMQEYRTLTAMHNDSLVPF